MPRHWLWLLVHVLVALLGVVALWRFAIPFAWNGLVDPTLEPWIYAWLAVWSLGLSVVGGALEGFSARDGHRVVGAVLWTGWAAFSIPVFGFALKWAPTELVIVTVGQLFVAEAFWVAGCAGQFWMAQRWARIPQTASAQ